MTSCLRWLPLLFKVAAQLHLSMDYLLVNESNEIKEKGCDTHRESSKVADGESQIRKR
jgi:hypothetical protein